MPTLAPSRSRITCSIIGLAVTGLLLPLVGCSAAPDAAESGEQLAEVASDPSTPEAAEDLDIRSEPDPIVEELECSPLLTLTVRGTGEPSGRQLLTPVANLVAQARPDQVMTHDLDYPASGDIKESATQGIRALIDTLNQQADVCESQRFTLMGYSQGALVVGDALIAPESRLLGETVGELSTDARDRIISVLLYADPRFVGSDPFNAGSFTVSRNGLLERAAGALDDYAERARSYCVGQDFICQAGLAPDEEGHVAYYSNGMQQDGAAFVITKLGEVPGDWLPDHSEEHVQGAETGDRTEHAP